MTNTVFFFGTLRHWPLLAAVLGDTGPLTQRAAALPGFAVNAAAEGPFPVIARDDGAQAEGLVVTGLGAQDRKRLDFYETIFDYAARNVVLKDGTEAVAYMAAPGRWRAAGDWSLEAWVRANGAVSVIAAEEMMRLYGHKSAAEVGRLMPTIRARAASTLRARHSRHGAMTFEGEAVIEDRRAVYASHFALDEFTVRHSRFDGTMSAALDRAVFRPPDAALVLPYDPLRDRVLLIEQVRMGPLIRGDRKLWQLEPIAGHIDAGESPQAAARREAAEEANLSLGALKPVAECYGSPGGSAEFYYLFLAIADLPERAQGTGGLESEHEDIRSHLIDFAQLMDLCDSFQVANAPLLLAAYWLARHREGLREEASRDRTA